MEEELAVDIYVVNLNQLYLVNKGSCIYFENEGNLPLTYNAHTLHFVWKVAKFSVKTLLFILHTKFCWRFEYSILLITLWQCRLTMVTEGCSIIKRAERALLNERIRSINNTITMFEVQRGTCKNKLNGILDKKIMEECVEFIKFIRESRHIKTLERQTLKFNQLCHKNTGGCSNHCHGKHGIHDHKQKQGRETTIPVSETTT